IRFALPDGTLGRAGGRVVKNVAGYDLNKLFIGSFGTLGVVVEATFKILPVPALRRAASATFKTSADAFAAADALVRTSLRPAAQAGSAAAAVRADRNARIVADAASAIVHVHLRDDADGLDVADGLVADAGVLGGSARLERSARARLEPFGGPAPAGAFLMGR